ncbi:MAG: RNA polymerase sigma factor [Methylococcales bacterium]|nr:RNA polymerase sigma factor [Methylococcales bacterium]
MEQTVDHSSRDAALIARICKADQKALEILYRHYYNQLARFITRVTFREDIIDEVINDVMFVVWEKAVSYDKECKPSTWIFGIAFNKARQAARDSNRNSEESLDDLDADNSYFEEDNDKLKQLEMTDWLTPALEQLTADQRAVIELTYFQGLPYHEIAVLMDCPENTVKTRMHHAKKKLAVLLNESN